MYSNPAPTFALEAHPAGLRLTDCVLSVQGDEGDVRLAARSQLTRALHPGHLQLPCRCTRTDMRYGTSTWCENRGEVVRMTGKAVRPVSLKWLANACLCALFGQETASIRCGHACQRVECELDSWCEPACTTMNNNVEAAMRKVPS